MEWYYSNDAEQQLGPVDDDTIKSLVSSGKIERGTMVWREGMEEWKQIEETEFSELLPATPSQPPSQQTDSVRVNTRVYPSVPPRSPHMSLLSLLGAGLAQIIFGKIWMGVTFVIFQNILMISVISFALDYNIAGAVVMYILALAATAASVTDGYMTANALKLGQWVGTWQFFPKKKG